MTSQPDEIRSMAEKVVRTNFLIHVDRTGEEPEESIKQEEFHKLIDAIEQALRTVSDRAYREGQESMRERVAELTVDHNGCVSDKCFMRNCATVLFDQIMALKPAPRDA